MPHVKQGLDGITSSYLFPSPKSHVQPPPPLFLLSFFLSFPSLSPTCTSLSFSHLHLYFSLHLLSSPHRHPHTQERDQDRERTWEWEKAKGSYCCPVEKSEKMGFWKTSSSRYQRFRSMIIRGSIDLKFCKEVHDTWISIVNDGGWIWSNLHSFPTREQ